MDDNRSTWYPLRQRRNKHLKLVYTCKICRNICFFLIFLFIILLFTFRLVVTQFLLPTWMHSHELIFSANFMLFLTYLQTKKPGFPQKQVLPFFSVKFAPSAGNRKKRKKEKEENEKKKPISTLHSTEPGNIHGNTPVLIGIGSMKSGSTYFIDALSLSNPGMKEWILSKKHEGDSFQTIVNEQKSSQQMFDSLPFIANNHHLSQPPPITFLQSPYGHELRYFSKCILFWFPFISPSSLCSKYPSLKNGAYHFTSCDWQEYLDYFWLRSKSNKGEALNISLLESINGVLNEKSPNYVREPHSAYLLSHYATSLRPKLFLYMIIRNPIDRIYSHFWFNCRKDVEKCNLETVKKNLLDGFAHFRPSQNAGEFSPPLFLWPTLPQTIYAFHFFKKGANSTHITLLCSN